MKYTTALFLAMLGLASVRTNEPPSYISQKSNY